MDSTVVKKSELVIDALQYAHDHNLDINNKDEVKKILDAIDPKHNESVDEFMELLKTSDVFMGMKARENKKSELPN
jgi:hypothetical protein